MLIKKNFEVLEHAVTQGRAGHMDLHFNTNGTIWNQELEDLLKNFRNVYFDLSIDDVKERCGYIRYSSDWALVSTNLNSFLKAKRDNSNFHFCVCVTINSLNVFYLDEIFDYFASVDLPVNFNMLHLPWHLNIKTLPRPVKEAVMQKLERYAVSDQASDWHRLYWQQHRGVVTTFLMTEVDSQSQCWREFEHYLRGLDRTRAQSFEQALPEFARLCGPWLAGGV
jgi:sulfatase maturation enzyme AslB (radical SAM superfamily)